MGTRGYTVYRYKGRYYAKFNQFDSYYEGLGKWLVSSIPTDPERYKVWLEKERLHFARIERELEEKVYVIDKDECDNSDKLYSNHVSFCEIPTALPAKEDSCYIEYVYLFNLDREVFTINHGVHFQMDKIPTEDDQWMKACSNSIYRYLPTVNANVCTEEHMASPAVDLPIPIREINGYAHKTVTAMTSLVDMGCGPVFLTRVLAQIIIAYQHQIRRYSREWEPTDFPFREMTYALVSLAGNQARFQPLPLPDLESREAIMLGVARDKKGWLGRDNPMSGGLGALPVFGHPFHYPSQLPGAAPPIQVAGEQTEDGSDEDEGKKQDSMYWLEENVLVFPTLVPDGEAIGKAAAYGLKEKKGYPVAFHIVAISIFEVAFADVSIAADNEVFIRATEPIRLSPIRPEFCYSNHPRERPARQRTSSTESDENDGYVTRQGERDLRDKICVGSAKRLSKYFPGLSALVNVLDAATARRAALYRCHISTTTCSLPQEMYDRILYFVDADTWRTCLGVSRELRVAACRAASYRIDDTVDIVDGPWIRKPRFRRGYRHMRCMLSTPTLSFSAKQRTRGDHGTDAPAVPIWILPFDPPPPSETPQYTVYNWMPVIGKGERKVAMPDVSIEFDFAGPWLPVEIDGDIDCNDSDFEEETAS